MKLSCEHQKKRWNYKLILSFSRDPQDTSVIQKKTTYVIYSRINLSSMQSAGKGQKEKEKKTKINYKSNYEKISVLSLDG